MYANGSIFENIITCMWMDNYFVIQLTLSGVVYCIYAPRGIYCRVNDVYTDTNLPVELIGGGGAIAPFALDNCVRIHVTPIQNALMLVVSTHGCTECIIYIYYAFLHRYNIKYCIPALWNAWLFSSYGVSSVVSPCMSPPATTESIVCPCAVMLRFVYYVIKKNSYFFLI